MAKRTKKVTYDQIDFYCPRYQEAKPGSTPLGATVLAIYGLLDGRYVWQIASVRKEFSDGARADWWIGHAPVCGPNAQVKASFAIALAEAREALAGAALPAWQK